uniref:Uncharacterized protein n=1 Tax=Cacopsylla melanoneura TaxID=428564 RepID=A0A8D8RBK3_9HEMI
MKRQKMAMQCQTWRGQFRQSAVLLRILSRLERRQSTAVMILFYDKTCHPRCTEWKGLPNFSRRRQLCSKQIPTLVLLGRNSSKDLVASCKAPLLFCFALTSLKFAR